MNIFMKAVAAVLAALILHLILSKQSKDFSLLLTVAVCSIVATAAFQYFEPVMDFFKNLQFIGNLNQDMLNILLKAVGIGLLSEITGTICSDAGNAAMGKTLHILASAVILWLSVPLFTSLLTLVEEILIAV